jgi:hypothetical protein
VGTLTERRKEPEEGRIVRATQPGIEIMPDPKSKPGPSDGSGLLVAGLAGVAGSLLLFLLLYEIRSGAVAYGVLPYIVAGAIVGLAIGFWRRLSR